MYRKVLVPVDFSEHSETVVKWIPVLKQLGVREVWLLHVLDELKIEHPAGGYDVSELMEEYSREAKEKLQEYRKMIEKEIEKVNICTIWAGDPAVVIVKRAEELDVDLIVMSSVGKGWFKELIVGSTSRKVARLSTKPVILIKKEWIEMERDYNFDHILVSGWIDDPIEDEDIEILKCELDNAIKLAKAFYENTGIKPFIRIFTVVTKFDRELVNKARNTVTSILNGINEFEYDLVIWTGDPVEDLIKAAVSFDADIVLVGAKKAYRGLSLGMRLTSLMSKIEVPIYVCK